MTTARFTFLTGQKRKVFRNARLMGSWDAQGRHSDAWSTTPMAEIIAEDGCPAFTTEVELVAAGAASRFRWGVVLDGPSGVGIWGIPTEVRDQVSRARHRELVLPAAGAAVDERYHLTWSRLLGAQKLMRNGVRIAFSVWAPNARSVDVVFSRADHGYIADDGAGIDPTRAAIPLQRTPGGVWRSAATGRFRDFEGVPYMFRIQDAQGVTRYHTDICSRWQIGRGSQNPARGAWDGDPRTLDGTVSSSVVVDQDLVRRDFDPPAGSPAIQVGDESFWSSELTSGLPVPTRLQDLVIYELHIGSLGFHHREPGRIADAMAFLDHLRELGVNAVEVLPMAEFSGNLSWGYGHTHPYVIESSAGGRDKFKHFVRECHRRGIAVIQDVVYNHFDLRATRAEWQYDSTAPEENIYYWYEGRAADHPRPDGGYLNNGSSGFTPRLWEEAVRQLFLSSAVELIEEFHIDGLRVDLTQALHRDNTLNANGWPVASANLFGQKLLREWSRALRMFRPNVLLIAEDHSGWSGVTASPDLGGLGFEATWYADFYHHLIGDSDMSGGAARLIREAGFGDDRPLSMDRFAGALWASQFNTVVYHESHDEAGNSSGSMRTIKAAVNGAPLFGATRWYAEARARVACGLSMLSAGTPMFFMGEEVGAQKRCGHDSIVESREDLIGERGGAGAKLFRFYQDIIRLRLAHPAIRSRAIDVIHAHNANRVIAFTRREGVDELVVVASLNNNAFASGYVIHTDAARLPPGKWREVFNSDAAVYGGSNFGNAAGELDCGGGRLQLLLPANGFVVLAKQPLR